MTLVSHLFLVNSQVRQALNAHFIHFSSCSTQRTNDLVCLNKRGLEYGSVYPELEACQSHSGNFSPEMLLFAFILLKLCSTHNK